MSERVPTRNPSRERSGKMKPVMAMLMVIFGGGDVIRRLLAGGKAHPLYGDVPLVVVAPQCLPQVQRLVKWIWPLSRQGLAHLLNLARSLYIGVPPDKSLSILKRVSRGGYRGQTIIVEKPLCKPSQIGQVRETCYGLNVVVDDHWLMAPVVKVLSHYLHWMRAQFGELLWLDVRLDETRLVDTVNSAPFLAMGSVWAEYLYHAFSLLRHIVPGFKVDVRSGRLFMTRHEGAPSGLLTFGAFVGLASGFGRFARTGRVAITISGGKGLQNDTKVFEFVFENGSLVYSHSTGRIILRRPDGKEKELLNNPIDPFSVVFDRWIADDPSAFQPLEETIATVAKMNRIQTSCLATSGGPGLVVIPAVHRAGKHPLPEWPCDGLASMTASSYFQKWCTDTQVMDRSAVRAKLSRVLLRPVTFQARVGIA
jgi:hypothetical protein